MKKYTLNLAIKMLLTVLSAVATGVLAARGYWWFAAATCVFTIWLCINVLHKATRSVKNMKRLIDAIRFAELNIAVKKGLPEELARSMEQSLAQFRHRLIKTETDQIFYDTLLQRIDSGIMVLNKNGHIEWINKAATDMFGRPHPRELSDLSSDIQAIMNELVPREVKLLTINNIRVAVTATYFSAGGKDLKLISFKNIQSALEEHESDAWRKLISVLTHEMMNSITPILSLSETLSEETENRQAVMKQAMQTIHRRSKGLVDFVKNYRQLTRIPEPITVSITVQEMITDIYHLLKAEGIDFSYSVNPADIQLNADRSQIEQVLINLIKNAWEACRDMPNPEIVVETRKNEYQKPVITVSDNGIGIIPNVMDKIFVPFFTTKTGGSGIGLTICRQIMNLHHGNISIESEVDKGTKITLRF